MYFGCPLTRPAQSQRQGSHGLTRCRRQYQTRVWTRFFLVQGIVKPRGAHTISNPSPGGRLSLDSMQAFCSESATSVRTLSTPRPCCTATLPRHSALEPVAYALDTSLGWACLKGPTRQVTRSGSTSATFRKPGVARRAAAQECGPRRCPDSACCCCCCASHTRVCRARRRGLLQRQPNCPGAAANQPPEIVGSSAPERCQPTT